MRRLFTFLFSCLPMFAVQAGEFDTRIPLFDKGYSTLYVKGKISGYGATEFMVDTGSGYATINESTLKVLRNAGQVDYVKLLSGTMADGKIRPIPVYRVRQLSIGGCIVKDVEVAVLPGNTRNILGLNVLKRTAPFAISVNPPSLMLSQCRGAA